MTLTDMQIVSSSAAACFLAVMIFIRRKWRFRQRDFVPVVAVLLTAHEIPMGFLLCSCALSAKTCQVLGAAIPGPYKFHIYVAGFVLVLASLGATFEFFRRAFKLGADRQAAIAVAESRTTCPEICGDL